MPNTYEATDPKTGQKWTWDGKKWNAVAKPSPVSEGAKTFGREAALGSFSTLGIPESKTPIQDLIKGSEPSLLQKLDPTGGALSGIAGLVTGLPKSATEIAEGAGGTSRTGLSGVFPPIGLLPEQTHEPDIGKFGHGLGSLITQILTLKGGKEAAEKPAGPSEVATGGKAVVRDLLGVGKRDVEGHIKKAATKEEAAHQAALAKVEKAKESYAGAVADAIKKRAAASAKETAAKTKQEALTSKHGPVYQRMNEMADAAQQHIGEMEEKVNKTESEKWDAFKDRMGDPPVQSQPTVDAITKAKANILTGDSVPVFNQILNEVIKDEGGAKEFIDMAGGIVLKTSEIPLNLARRLYTKIGRKLGGSELPKDVARALGSVSDALDKSIAESVVRRGNEISDFAKKYDINPRPPSAQGLVSFQDRVTGASIEMREGFTEEQLAEKLKTKRAEIGASERSDVSASKGKAAGQKAIEGGAEALRDYRKLQADWKQYRETFSDRNSPLRKIAEAKDPSTKLGPITGETGARAIDYLGRYRDLGAQPELLGRIRALHKALKELPGGGGKAPATPERPTLPETPARQVTTPEQAREQMLAGKASSFSRPPSKWELMFPPLLMYKQGLKHLLQNPEFRKWLAKDNPSTPVP